MDVCTHVCVNEQHSASAPAPNQAWQLKAVLLSGHDTWSNLAFGAFTSAPDKDPLFKTRTKTQGLYSKPPLFLSLTHIHTHTLT